jgi:hypothetical protein
MLHKKDYFIASPKQAVASTVVDAIVCIFATTFDQCKHIKVYSQHRKIVLKTSVTASFAAAASASFSNVTQKGLFYCIA